MRQSTRHISVLFFGACMLLNGACTNELVPTPAKEIVPLSDFQLGYQLDVTDVYTKAQQSVEIENTVRNLYVLLFAEDGHLVHSKRYLVTTNTSLTEEQQSRYDAVLRSFHTKEDEGSNRSSGIIPEFFTNYKGRAEELDGNLTFYGIANYSTAVDQDLDNLADDGPAAETNLRNMTIDIAPGSVERNYFFMVAELGDVHLNPTVNGNSISVERIGANLELRRLDAKVTFNIDVRIDGADNVSFENPTYKVHRIPNKSYLIERAKSSGVNNWDAAQNTETDFSCMDDDNFEHFDSFNGTSGFFAFYMRENRPVPSNEINGEARDKENANGKNYKNLYVMREAWPYDADKADSATGKTPVHERDFTYAPENSTFVEISGNLNYTRKRENPETHEMEDEYVSGIVTYIVHLGETGGADDINDIDAVNNYDVRRNVRYIYNMRITGINSFEVEVSTDGKEERPGAEGDLAISDSQQFLMDSHYGRILLELDRDDIIRNVEQGGSEQAGWNVSSPLGTTKFDGQTISYPYDYKWILFAINREFKQTDDKMVKFPGTQAYDGGVRFFDDKNESAVDQIAEIADDRGNKLLVGGKTMTFKKYLDQGNDTDNYYYSYEEGPIDDDACLRDINQLLKHLYEEARSGNSDLFDEDGKVAITAFCDEYTYLYDPRKEDYVHPGTPKPNESDLLLWKEYVNTDDRVLNITPMVATDYSKDMNTSITHSFVKISQMAIKTIYNENDPDLKTAWGLETTNETGPLTWNAKTNIYRGNKTNTSSDGRTNFLNFWLETDSGSGGYQAGDINWTDVMTVNQRIENADGLTANYRDAFHACITRNRDLDGNNKIDENEIYWYLAAQDQLSGLYIGQPALEESAWMYTGDGTTMNHLVTSTYNGNSQDKTNFWILWSEEGASWGKLHGSGDESTERYDYRCIRNLGISIGSYDAPEHYAKISGQKYDSESRNSYNTVDVGVINSRALRSAPDEGSFIPLDHERSQNNQPFKSFDVLSSVYGSKSKEGITWTEMRDKIYANDNSDICPEGWRPPNQREFLIMMSLRGINGFSLSEGPTYGLGIATSFSFNGLAPYYTNGERYGFYFSTNLVLHNENESEWAIPGDPYHKPMLLRFRCVRDTPSAY